MIAIVDLGAEETDFLIKVIEGQRESFLITADEAEIIKSDKIILAASGDAGTAVRNLHLLNLFTILRICKRPMLGICLGMHLMGEYFREDAVSCLGIFPVSSETFIPPGNKKPFTGMHSVSLKIKEPVYSGIPDGEIFYFFNSCYFPVNQYTSAVADNNLKFSASVQKDNFYGIQFSPSKSGEAGIKVIQNFLELPV